MGCGQNIQQMFINMDETDSQNFRKFVLDHWGVNLNERGDIVRN